MSATTAHQAAMNHLANEMDELKHQAVGVMQRYEETFTHAQASGTFAGSAGSASVSSGTDIHQAQMRIQQKFEQINELLRHGAATYTGADQDNAHQMASLTGHLKWH